MVPEPNCEQRVKETADYLKARMKAPPRLGLLTGTGLGESAAFLSRSVALPYADIPHFPAATVQSHAGKLLIGDVDGFPLMAMQGRFHLYEGHSPQAVTYPIRVMQALGVETVIITNAAGGLSRSFATGEVMIIADHINLTGANPLVGPNIDGWGPRFPDMTRAYDEHLMSLARKLAARAGVRLQQGVYAGLQGPSLETPAEIRFLQRIGADAVGFSTVLEVIAAAHAGIRVLGLATITNINDPDNPVPATVEDIIAAAGRTAPALERLIRMIVEHIHASETS
jgi:purine-nucleoside phosphorylase